MMALAAASEEKNQGAGAAEEGDCQGLRQICQGVHAAAEVRFQLPAGVLWSAGRSARRRCGFGTRCRRAGLSEEDAGTFVTVALG